MKELHKVEGEVEGGKMREIALGTWIQEQLDDGMTTDELSVKLDVTHGMLSKYKRYKAVPRIGVALKVFVLTAGEVVIKPYSYTALKEELENG